MSARKSFCLNHTDVQAVANCVQCHKPVCGTCVIPRGGQSFCSDVCAQKYDRFYANYKPGAGKRWRTLKAILKLAVVVALLLAALHVGRILGVDLCERVLKLIGL